MPDSADAVDKSSSRNELADAEAARGTNADDLARCKQRVSSAPRRRCGRELQDGAPVTGGRPRGGRVVVADGDDGFRYRRLVVAPACDRVHLASMARQATGSGRQSCARLTNCDSLARTCGAALRAPKSGPALSGGPRLVVGGAGFVR